MTIAPVNTQAAAVPEHPGGGRGLREVHQRQGRHRRTPAARSSPATTRVTPTRAPTAPARRSTRRSSPSSARSSFDASRIIPVLEEAKIPWFGGCCPLVAQEFTSPDLVRPRLAAPRHGRRPRLQDGPGRVQAPRRRGARHPRRRRRPAGVEERLQGRRWRSERVQGRQDRRRPAGLQRPGGRGHRAAPTASPAASPTPTGRPGCRRWPRPVPRSGSTACRATSTARSPSSSPSSPRAASSSGSYPNIAGHDVGRLPRRRWRSTTRRTSTGTASPGSARGPASRRSRTSSRA